MKVKSTKCFQKKYKKLPPSLRLKVKERINLFVNNSFHILLNNHSVHPIYKESRSINIIGDYMTIYVQEVSGDILFTHIGTHSELYD